MTAVRALQEQFANIGYFAIARNYVFSDVFSPSSPNRRVPVAAFTHTPHSYRNAALAVIESDRRPALEVVSEYRALGAPLLFVVQGNEVVVWQVRSEATPREIARTHVTQLPALFSKYREAWSPLSIQRAKSIGQFNPVYQLDFVDLGLLPAIEGEIHDKLDRLLNQALAHAIDPQTQRPSRIGERALFRAVFRFLAAKILQDRLHPLASTWDQDRIDTILDKITQHYRLPPLHVQTGTAEHKIFALVWDRIRGGINFQNISADDLAFVYESTLVTDEIRKALGTHSTPRQVAEYIVCHLGFHEYADAPEQFRIYEPFAGAAVLLISALRHIRELLPVTLTDQQRHDFLIKHMSGDEVDGFACEVATLSLILADYPSHNGWLIREKNLFEDGVLRSAMRENNVILCNPPFGAFSQEERAQLSIAQGTHSKAIAVLNEALDAHPLALGFVLPRTFILERQFSEHRKRLEKLYGSVELVEVPDRIFRHSQVESALLIAREPRPPAPQLIKLRSTEVADRDGQRFLRTGETTTSRSIIRAVASQPSGDLWIPPLTRLWTYIEEYPRLNEKLRPSWGLQWKYHQSRAWSEEARDGFQKGFHNAEQIKQFFASRPVWLDYRKRYVRRGYKQKWDEPKLIINAARFSRGPWRIGATVDLQGLLYSQQFYGLWPTKPLDRHQLLALSAVLNGPLANAYIAAHSPSNRFRASAVKRIPIPTSLPLELGDLVSAYMTKLAKPKLFDDGELITLLHRIDAAVLKAYDLPPRLERELLELFRDTKRPVGHQWTHWLPERFEPFIPLHEFVSEQYHKATQPWTQEVFKPLPPEEVEALREYMD
jgi:hypothetical protein